MSSSGDGHNESLARLGIVLSVISAVFTSTGLCLQKLHLRQQKTQSESSSGGTKYIAGIAYVAIGLLLKAPISVMLPQVTVALMSAQTVLYSCILEYLFLRSHMSRTTAVCLLAIFCGIILGVGGSSFADLDYSFMDIVDLFFSFRAISFTVVCLGCMCCAAEFCKVAISEPSPALRLVQSSVLCGLVAGLFGTATKALFEVLYFNTYYSTDRTFSWNAWMLFLPAAALGFSKMRCVSAALREFPAWKFLPLYQSFAILLNAVCGLLYFDEVADTYREVSGGGYSCTAYFTGLLLVTGGVACLMLRHSEYTELSTLTGMNSVSLSLFLNLLSHSHSHSHSHSPDADILSGKALPGSNEEDYDSESDELEEFHVSGGLTSILPPGEFMGRVV